MWLKSRNLKGQVRVRMAGNADRTRGYMGSTPSPGTSAITLFDIYPVLKNPRRFDCDPILKFLHIMLTANS